MTEEQIPTEVVPTGVISGKKKFSLSPLQKKLAVVIGVVLLSVGTYTGYSVVQNRGIGAASCVSHTYKLNNQNKCVTYIQQILNAADIDQTLTANGKYSSSTKSAVVIFQKAVELTGSGIVDHTTWQQLCEVAGSSVEDVYTLAGCDGLEVDTQARNIISMGSTISDDTSNPPQSSNSDSFSIVSMPDTQSEVVRDVKDGVSPRGLVSKDMQWIVNNRNDRNVQVVVSPGDLTHAAAISSNASVNAKISKMWVSISKSYQILDEAGVPYSITTGNHDTAATSLNTKSNSYGSRKVQKNHAQLFRDTSRFNQTFSVARGGMKGLTLKDAGRAENSYRTFRVKNTNWLVLAMEYSPRREVLDWAKSVVSSHSKYNVVVVTHAYMKSGSTKLSTTCDASDCVSAQTIHDELVVGYPNVKMLFSGHTIVESIVEEKSSSGNKVIQYRTTMHACMGDQPCRNPIRILKIDLVNSTVTSELCLNITASSAKDCKTKVTTGMRFVSSETKIVPAATPTPTPAPATPQPSTPAVVPSAPVVSPTSNPVVTQPSSMSE